MSIEAKINESISRHGVSSRAAIEHHRQLIKELRELKYKQPHLLHIIEELELLAGVILKETGTPNQQGSITRVLNTLKQQKVGTMKIENYLKRKAGF